MSKHIEHSDEVKQAITQHNSYIAWLCSIDGGVDGTRGEVACIVCDHIWELLKLIDVVESVYGKGTMPCKDELTNVYKTYDSMVNGEN